MKFTQIPTDTFEKLQLNAGILCSGFVPATGAVTGIIGATTGGISFSDSPEFKDFGEDIDNCPKNTKELKKIDDRTVTMTGTFLTVSTATVKLLAGAADIGATDTTKVTPRVDLVDADFGDIWFVGDYSDKNGATNGGYLAIHMLNALSTGGFSMQTTDKEKGQFAFEFTGHYSIEAIDTVPYEVYVKAGTAE